MIRAAQVKGARSLSEVSAYMPSNYLAAQTVDGEILIVGVDSMGWTLDEYVIPRLGSGNMCAVEINDDALDTIRAWSGKGAR